MNGEQTSGGWCRMEQRLSVSDTVGEEKENG